MSKIMTTPETKAARQFKEYIKAGIDVITRIKPDGEIILEPLRIEKQVSGDEAIDLTDFRR